MKKMKLVWLSMALIGTVLSFTACGDKGGSSDGGDSYAEGIFDDEPEGDDNVSEGGDFGAEVAEDYPISPEMQSQLDALDTNYKKVNWQIAYAPADNDGIIVSETSYINTKGKCHLVVAYTNLTDEAVKLSYEGYAQNQVGDVVKDLVESNLEISAKNTIVRDLNFEDEEPSGEIDWKSFSVDAAEKEYIPYEVSAELLTENNGEYYIQGVITADGAYTGERGYGFVLDEDGNIIEGAEESVDRKVKFFMDSFGGKNEDVVFFVNVYKV